MYVLFMLFDDPLYLSPGRALWKLLDHPMLTTDQDLSRPHKRRVLGLGFGF
jgi:hypothetical protein